MEDTPKGKVMSAVACLAIVLVIMSTTFGNGGGGGGGGGGDDDDDGGGRTQGAYCSDSSQCSSYECMANHCCADTVQWSTCVSCSPNGGVCSMCVDGFHVHNGGCVLDTTTTTTTTFTSTTTTSTKKKPCLDGIYDGPHGTFSLLQRAPPAIQSCCTPLAFQ